MLILILLFVEEDVFVPVLPKPEVEPEIEWFRKIEKNWINLASNRKVDYNYAAFKFCDLEFESLRARDFSDNYHLKASIKSLSYSLTTDYIYWDDIDFSKTVGSKWFLEEGGYLLGWFEAYSLHDSIVADVGVRFYQLLGPFFIGGWTNYRERLDYGLAIQLAGFRGELGKERRCVGLVNDLGEIKAGRFRDRFPLVFYPVENFMPRVGIFHGARINFLDFKFDGGRKYIYAEGEDTLRWIKGEAYFANIEFERESFGFQYYWQDKGLIRRFGEAYAIGRLGFLEAKISLTGYLTPKKYVTGGFSLWLTTKISPFVSLYNLSWVPDDDFRKPVYYVGIRYAD
jgi:hypothetical protein